MVDCPDLTSIVDTAIESVHSFRLVIINRRMCSVWISLCVGKLLSLYSVEDSFENEGTLLNTNVVPWWPLSIRIVSSA